MLALKKILVPMDQAPSALRAFRFAHSLAERYDAEIHVLHVLSFGSPRSLYDFFQEIFKTGDAAETVRAKIEHQIEQAIETPIGQHPRIRRVNREGAHVAQEILHYAAEEKVDLIVLGTHGHRRLDYALGGTAGEVVRRAEGPVLTVRNRDDHRPQAEAIPVNHVLVPVDFSEHAADAARVAQELATRYGASLSLLFVAEERTVPLFSDTGLFTLTTVSMDPDIVKQARRALKQLHRSVAGADAAATYQVRKGYPAREILEYAEEHGVDLIVMSTHGQTAAERFMLGSVTDKVARRSTCPVLTLKAFRTRR